MSTNNKIMCDTCSHQGRYNRCSSFARLFDEKNGSKHLNSVLNGEKCKYYVKSTSARVKNESRQ